MERTDRSDEVALQGTAGNHPATTVSRADLAAAYRLRLSR